MTVRRQLVGVSPKDDPSLSMHRSSTVCGSKWKHFSNPSTENLIVHWPSIPVYLCNNGFGKSVSHVDMVFFNDFNELMLFPKRAKYTAYKIAQFYINNKKSKRKLWITLLENVVLNDCNELLMFHKANRIINNLNQSVTITFSLVLMQVFE